MDKATRGQKPQKIVVQKDLDFSFDFWIGLHHHPGYTSNVIRLSTVRCLRPLRKTTRSASNKQEKTPRRRQGGAEPTMAVAACRKQEGPHEAQQCKGVQLVNNQEVSSTSTRAFSLFPFEKDPMSSYVARASLGLASVMRKVG